MKSVGQQQSEFQAWWESLPTARGIIAAKDAAWMAWQEAMRQANEAKKGEAKT